MKVSELTVGKLYKIRSDRETHVLVHRGYLDVHVATSIPFNKDASVKIRPMDHFIYLGYDRAVGREVLYRGQRLKTYSNIWQHIVPVEMDE